jgi:autotransporter-associated beta strand protein
MFNLAAINILAGGAVIDSAANTISIAQPLLDGGGNGGLTKLGSGKLYLNGANTYTGPTLVSAGTLAGTGSVAGPVTVASGATLSAGAGSIGVLTVNNTLTLSAGSTTYLKLGSSTNDEIVGLTGVSYGGTLMVTNITGAPFADGTVFKLFDSTTAGSGNFASVTILPSGAGTFNPATGELTIGAAAQNPAFNPVTVSGGNLILSGSGTAGTSYTLLTTTNLAMPMALWTTNYTGTISESGTFTNSIPMSNTNPARYFRVRTP